LARNFPFYAQAYEFDLALPSQADPRLHQVNPTLASGDVKISKDNGAFANLATLPSVNPAGGANVQVQLSATEMTCKNAIIRFSDAAGAEWCDVEIHLQPQRGIAIPGAVNDASATATGFVTDATGLGTSAIVGKFLVFTTGALAGLSQKITAYTTATGAVTVNAFPSAPANSDEFMIIGMS